MAFDVLQEIDPRYTIRIAGLLLATAQLARRWIFATRHLMRQEDLSQEEMERYRREAGREGGVNWDLIKRAFVEYLRPGFHPDQHDDYELARASLRSVGIT